MHALSVLYTTVAIFGYITLVILGEKETSYVGMLFR